MVVTDYARLILALSVVVSLLSFVAAFFFLRVKKAKVQRQIMLEKRNAELKAMEAEYAEHQVNIYRATPATNSDIKTTNSDNKEAKIKDLTSM